ncbi:MAG TPA: hypothetical protein VHZ03_45675 [Trebonia sp.]|nr:hypothetical protein [Trebonia sp.]
MLRTPVAIRTTTDTAHRENFASWHPSYGLLTCGLLFVPFAGCILLSSNVPSAVGPGFGMTVAPAGTSALSTSRAAARRARRSGLRSAARRRRPPSPARWPRPAE